jgi:hypothetical protein
MFRVLQPGCNFSVCLRMFFILGILAWAYIKKHRSCLLLSQWPQEPYSEWASNISSQLLGQSHCFRLNAAHLIPARWPNEISVYLLLFQELGDMKDVIRVWLPSIMQTHKDWPHLGTSSVVPSKEQATAALTLWPTNLASAFAPTKASFIQGQHMHLNAVSILFANTSM